MEAVLIVLVVLVATAGPAALLDHLDQIATAGPAAIAVPVAPVAHIVLPVPQREAAAAVCRGMMMDCWRVYPVVLYQNIVVEHSQGMVVATLCLDMMAVAAAYCPRKAVVVAMEATMAQIADQVDTVDLAVRMERRVDLEIEIAPAAWVRTCHRRVKAGFVALELDFDARFYPGWQANLD